MWVDENGDSRKNYDLTVSDVTQTKLFHCACLGLFVGLTVESNFSFRLNIQVIMSESDLSTAVSKNPSA